jgi:FHS family L-fucose permease-like MFS transporter
VTEVRPGTSNSEGAIFLSIAQGCFAIGRFTGTGLMKTTKPRYVFLLFYTGATLFVGISVGTRRNAGLGMAFHKSE